MAMVVMHAALGVVVGIAGVLAGPPRGERYLVLVDPGERGEYRAAAERMAGVHGGKVVEFDTGDLEGAMEVIRREGARWVVFVAPPAKIDVELSRRVLEMAVRVDDDPFVDIEYGFITGRDGAAAEAFVERIAAWWEGGGAGGERTAALFGSWEGPALPAAGRFTSMEAMGLRATAEFVLMKDPPEVREERARGALGRMKGKDALLFFSHGYPNEMVGCYTGKQLREWGVDLGPAVLFNSSCYNGAPGRWWEPTGMGFVEREAPAAEESVALATLESGVTGAFLGVDPWHGPLTCQVFALAVDEGVLLGEAAKRMFDRLALEFLPRRIEFGPVAERRVLGEGVENRRSNGAGMIFYGDPMMTLRAGGAEGEEGGRGPLIECVTEGSPDEPGRLRARITMRPMLRGLAGPDSMVPMWRLANYYSVRTADVMGELAPEVYRVVELPEWFEAHEGENGEVRMRVVSARVGKKRELPTGEVQAVMEAWRGGGRRLHIRVPIEVRMFGTPWAERMMREGVEVVVESVVEEGVRE